MATYERKDKLYQRAKEEGFASRASYKLIEIDDKHRLLKQGARVLDLGAWPGGWLQVASERVGPRGKIVGIDLVEITEISLSNVTAITGDVRDGENIAKAKEIAGGRFDLVLSDMSPKLSGIREVDQAGTVGCAELALFVAQRALRKGGSFVAKVFKGNDTEQFVKTMRPIFNKIARMELNATRKTSNEFYVIGLELKVEID